MAKLSENSEMPWVLSHRADKSALPLADRHYNRQKPGTPQFVPPGRCLVLLAPDRTEPKALWVTSWPFPEYVKHAWPGAWVCSCFRNEGAGLSSMLITQAVSATRARYGDPPTLGFVTFINAGWQHIGFTKGGLYVLQLLPDDMPPPLAARVDSPLFARVE